jgi:hypothetical protein
MRAPIQGGALAAVRQFRIVWLAASFQCLDEDARLKTIFWLRMNGGSRIPKS